MIYEDIFSVSIIQKAYKSNRISFFEKIKLHKVSCAGLSLGVTLRLGCCRAIENTVCTV